jgi:hypothetical protein
MPRQCIVTNVWTLRVRNVILHKKLLISKYLPHILSFSSTLQNTDKKLPTRKTTVTLQNLLDYDLNLESNPQHELRLNHFSLQQCKFVSHTLLNYKNKCLSLWTICFSLEVMVIKNASQSLITSSTDCLSFFLNYRVWGGCKSAALFCRMQCCIVC